MIIHIPVKPHVRQFLATSVGEPYRISTREDLGLFLFSLLRKPVIRNEYEEYLGRYQDRFAVVLSKHQVFHYGCRSLDANSIIMFNRKVEDMINQLFLAVVDAQVDLGSKYSDAIRYFMERYDYFDMDELNFEMLKMRYYRYRKKQKTQKNV